MKITRFNSKMLQVRKDFLTMLMWLIAFIALFVLALQPVLQSRSNLSMAGGPTNGTGYNNAPATVISNGKALFTANGVNADVLMELLNVVNSTSVWGSKTAPTSGSTVNYLSAKDFGQYDSSGNAQIVLKLLDTTSVTINNVDDAAAQYWQVVYRSTSANEDVLTLYMTNSYMTNQFNPSSTNGIYRYEGNYSQSYIRDNAVLPTYETMKSTYSQLDQYVVTPSQVPGSWQSNAYQTSRNNSRASYSTGNGTSGLYNNSSYYSLENGMDGGSGGHLEWQGTVERTYTDKLWVPSNFEVIHTGYAGEDTTIQDTGRTFDEGEGVSYVSNNTSASATLSNVTSGEDGRTGLWELNGYDRAWGDTSVTSRAWLRSGYSNYANSARGINSLGNSDRYNVGNPFGVRVALHLNLKSLATNLLSSGTLASISASANASSDCTLGVSLSEGDGVQKSTDWNTVISNKYDSWTNNFFNYASTKTKPYIFKNSSESSITATYTFDTTNYKMSSFTLNGTHSVTLSADSGSGTASGICDYAYQINDGNVTITISNAQTDVSIVALVESLGFELTFNYSQNGGTSATATSVTYTEGASVDLSPKATKSGWGFVGWNTNANATTGLTSYNMPGQATTLYAIFRRQITANFYQINATTPTAQSVTIYNNATNGQINAPSITTSGGQIAEGWTTTPTSTTASVKAGASITISGGETYYAIVRYSVTIAYDGNGGTGSTGNSSGTAYLTANGTASANTTNAQITLAQNAFNRPNYTFVAWALNSASGTQYNAGSAYTTSTNVTFYAVWSKNTSTTNINITLNVPTSKSIIIYILNGTKDNYTNMTQIVVNSTQTVSLELSKNATYTIIVSKPYSYQLSFSGTGAVINNSYTFNTANADTTTDQTISISGVDSGINNSVLQLST